VTSSPAARPAAVPVSTAEPTRIPPTLAPTPTATPPAFETMLSFGVKGMGVGQFDDANVVAPDNAGHVYVSERHGGRIQVFDEAGKFLNQWFVANPKPKTLITSLAADGKGNLFVATDDEIVTRYEGQTGRLLNQVPYAGGPGFTKIALMPNGGLAAIHSIDSGIGTAPREGVQDNLGDLDAPGRGDARHHQRRQRSDRRGRDQFADRGGRAATTSTSWAHITRTRFTSTRRKANSSRASAAPTIYARRTRSPSTARDASTPTAPMRSYCMTVQASAWQTYRWMDRFTAPSSTRTIICGLSATTPW